MKRTKNQIMALMVSAWISSLGLCAEPFAQGPYLGQTPPGPVAQVFAPGLICYPGPHQWEGNGTFSADGNTFCFQRASGVFITENTDHGWTKPELIRSIPANVYSPWSACLSPDANSIFFTRATGPESECNLYRCNRTARGWAKPEQLGPPLSSPSHEVTCSLAADNSIYFGSRRKYNKIYIWFAPFVDDTWPRAERISLNHPHGGDPGIAPDESFMVFTAINLPGGYGHRDIYLTLRLPDGTWSKPRNLGPRINTAYIEHGPRISPDKKYLFFNRSNGWDPRICAGDIYWVALKEYLPESYR
jgi:hypothetical protein